MIINLVRYFAVPMIALVITNIPQAKQMEGYIYGLPGTQSQASEIIKAHGIPEGGSDKTEESGDSGQDNPAAHSDTGEQPSVSVARPNLDEARAYSTSREGIEKLIREIFGAHSADAIKIFNGESGLKVDSKGWNCYYGKISKSCAKQDRGRAWSVDCGVAQINVKGQECPAELLEARHNIEHAKGMFDRRGWCPWVVAKKLGYCSTSKKK